jgi:hypothetical protein
MGTPGCVFLFFPFFTFRFMSDDENFVQRILWVWLGYIHGRIG